MEELIELPVIIDESNEILTLIVDKATAARASNDPQLLQRLINQNTQNINESNDTVQSSMTDSNITNKTVKETSTDESNAKGFVWPDAAVFLLIELYREKEQVFNTGMKRHNVIWGDIAAEMKEANKNYLVTGLQCSTKFAGLKRTYKNIYEQNKKSGNSHSSWAFYSTMDSLIGSKAYIQPPAEASSEGPTRPQVVESIPGSSTSESSSSLDVRGAPKKRRVETILDNYITDLRHERMKEKEQRDEERKKKDEKREAKYEERNKQREQMHTDNIEIQKSLLTVLQTIANKK